MNNFSFFSLKCKGTSFFTRSLSVSIFLTWHGQGTGKVHVVERREDHGSDGELLTVFVYDFC